MGEQIWLCFWDWKRCFFRSLVIKQLFCISSLLVVVVPITYLEIQQGDVCFMFFQVLLCQKRIKEQHEKDKRIYANMFQKFAERDSKVMDLFTKTATRGCDKHDFRFGKKWRCAELVCVSWTERSREGEEWERGERRRCNGGWKRRKGSWGWSKSVDEDAAFFIFCLLFFFFFPFPILSCGSSVLQTFVTLAICV